MVGITFPSEKYNFMRTVRVTAAEKALEKDKWDGEAWEHLLTELTSQQLDHTRGVYEEFFALFPRAVKYWKIYLTKELTADNIECVRGLLRRLVQELPVVQIWSVYLNFLSNAKSNTNAEELDRAYEMAINTIGWDINSTQIWMEYVEHATRRLTALQGQAYYTALISMRDNLRKLMEYPVTRLEEFFRKLGELESKCSDERNRDAPVQPGPGGKNRLSEEYQSLQRTFKRTQDLYKYKQALREHLIEDMVPTPPHSSASHCHRAAAAHRPVLPVITSGVQLQREAKLSVQDALWMRLIEFEKTISGNNEDRVKLVYRQALVARYFSVEIWLAYAQWLIENNRADEAEIVYGDAIKALPTNLLIHFVYADHLCAMQRPEKVEEAERLLDRLLVVCSEYGVDTTLVWIQYHNLVKASKGLEKARNFFVQRAMKEKRPHMAPGWQYYVFVSRLEAASKKPVNATNVMNLALKFFDGEMRVQLANVKLLEELHDNNNAGARLRTLEDSDQFSQNLELWSAALKFEAEHGSRQTLDTTERKFSLSFPHLTSRCPVRTLMLRYRMFDLSPLQAPDIVSLEHLEQASISLGRYLQNRLDKSIHAALFKDITYAAPPVTLSPQDRIPAHSNPLLDALGVRMRKPDFSSATATAAVTAGTAAARGGGGGYQLFESPINPTPPDRHQDQLSDIPCVPPSMLPSRDAADGGARGGAAPAQVMDLSDLPNELRKFVAVLPNTWTGPVVNVDSLLSLLVTDFKIPVPDAEPPAKRQRT